MSSREVILRRIRDALGPDRDVPTIAREYRTSSHLDPASVVDRFAEVVDDYRATVHRCSSEGLAGTIAAILTRSGDTRVAVPAELTEEWLADASDAVEVFRDAHPTQLSTADLDTVDAVVTNSAVAIAETGTIVLDASGDQGRRALTLVPDHHVCVVHADRIVATVPEALAWLDPQRPLTMISGPSATSDIELDRVEGVHGPRTLDVIVVSTP